MVKIIDGWELHTNAYGYVLQYNTGKITIDKDGNKSIVYAKTKYPKDIKQALKIIKREMIIDHIQNNDIILSDLTKIYQEFSHLYKWSLRST